MELNAFHRLILLNVLPKEGDFTTLKIVRKLREDLSFSEEEHKELQFKRPGESYKDNDGIEKIVPPGQMVWNRAADVPKDITIGEKAADVIVSVLKKLDKDKKLQDQHFDVYSKFVAET